MDTVFRVIASLATLVRRRPIVLLLTAALVGWASSDGSAQMSAPPRVDASRAPGDTLIRGLAANVSGLIPNITGDKYSHEAVALIYSGLITHDKDTNIIPDLAESWSLAPDCKEVSFKLRRNVKWHDGKPFTADDVIFTYQLMAHPKTPSPYKDDFEDVASVESADPHTVRVRYKSQYANALMIWGQSILPKHLLESYMVAGKLKEAPQNFNNHVG